MKIVLYKGYGTPDWRNQELQVLQGRRFPEDRIALAKHILQNQEIYRQYRVGDTSSYYYLPSSQKGVNSVVVCIEDVNTNRPWTVTEYDGSESIFYFDAYEVKNAKINYCTPTRI